MTPTRRPRDIELLHELEHVVEAGLNSHLAKAKDWMPHDYVPWSQGRDFAFLGGTDWEPAQSRLDPVVRTSMLLNLLTEDNLPSYHRDIALQFGLDGAWGQWIGRWTAEEGRHSIALRDYLVVTPGIDPVELENLRMGHVRQGYRAPGDEVLPNIAYVTIQELATRVSHRNTGRQSGCPLADQLLARIATDENLHMVFYRRLGKEAFDLAPAAMMRAVTDVIVGFAMPAAGQGNFGRAAAEIALAGLYDLPQHRDEVLHPVLRFWRVWDREDLGPEGDRARDELAAFFDHLDTRVARFEEMRHRTAARRANARPTLTSAPRELEIVR